MKRKAIVVGGGSAGIACALHLQGAGVDYVMITDQLGGRIRYFEKERVNLGAYFVMKNYRHARKLVIEGQRINPLKVMFHNSDTEYYPTLSLKALLDLPDFIRFALAIRAFYKHYEGFKKNCLIMSHQEALQKDAYLTNLFNLPAAEFINQHRFKKAADDFISKFSFACTGVTPDKITAFDFLNVCLGMVIPIYKFKFDRAEMENRLEGRLRYDTVTSIGREDDRYVVGTASGQTLQAESVVVATPAAVTQQLLGLDTIRQACKLYAYHVEAELKEKYRQQKLNLFPPDSDIVLTALEDDGTYIIYTRDQQARLNKVGSIKRVINMVAWEKAMYVYGDAYWPQQYKDKLYIAGDHNGLGLEPAAISGIYAANRIMNG